MRAIATFERTLVDHDSSYDRYARGDTTAMTAEQIHGLTVFADSGCTGCHTGPIRAVDVPTGSDRDDVKAFLGALSDGDYDRTIPTDVPSGLEVGGSINP